MRERKYRAYHDKWGWASPDDIWISGEGMVYVDYRGENGDKIACYTEKTKELHVMDYIGREDKNSKEIYEEDIIQFGEQSDLRATVEFEGAAFMIHWHQPNAVTKNQGDYMYETWFVNPHVPIKIIGNKYDNPELLKK